MPCSVAILLQYQLVKAAAAAAQCSVAQMQCWMLCLYWLQPHLKRFSCKQNGRRVNAALSSASGSVYPRRMRHQKTKQKKASGLKHTSTSLRRQHYCAYAYAASLRSFTGVVLIVSAHKRSAARRQRATHTACNTCFPCLLETRRRAPHYRATNLRRAAGNNRSANMSLPRRH